MVSNPLHQFQEGKMNGFKFMAGDSLAQKTILSEIMAMCLVYQFCKDQTNGFQVMRETISQSGSSCLNKYA